MMIQEFESVYQYYCEQKHVGENLKQVNKGFSKDFLKDQDINAYFLVNDGKEDKLNE